MTGAAAVVLAAGRSERLAGVVPKPFLMLAGRRVLDYSLAALGDAPSVRSVIVVVPEGLRDELEGQLLAMPKVVAGSARNVKITRPGDIELCRALLAAEQARTGEAR